MRKILNTLYITDYNYYLSLDGENIVVKEEGKAIGRVPLHNLEGIVTFGYTGASPKLMKACADKQIALSFLDRSGRFLARIVGETHGNVLLRKRQFLASENEEECLDISRNFIVGKIYNARYVLDRTIRDHSMRVEAERLQKAKERLLKSIEEAERCTDLEMLRGIEGEAAQSYFGVFDHMIINQKEDFFFHGRSKRPPLDCMNALLSLLYTLLTHDCAAALEGVGLDSYVGFMHKDRPGRTSLALDLMEELRAPFADRLALTLINRQEISGSDFERQENGAMFLKEEPRKTVIDAWQQKKKTMITHPFLNEKMEWGLVPHMQAMLLARYLRGDIEAYPPFLWK